MERHFRWLVLILCGSYLSLQVCYIARLPLVMDEFANAGHIYRLAQGVPYRDYTPYKSVLGYYLLLPALLAVESSWTALLAVKLEIACLTALALAVAALRLRRHFAPAALLGSLLLLCTQSTFLERSSELRTDMLAALFGLVSLVAYLERRSLLAGVMAGVAVLVTQKAAYFVIALGGALVFQALYCRSRQQLRELLQAGAAAALALVGYVGVWCAVGSPQLVWRSLFLQPRRIAFEQLYTVDLDRYWWQTLTRNPVFYAIAACGLVLLLPRWKAREDSAQVRLWSYAVILLGLCVWHKQPWPYFFVFLLPTAWVLSAAVLTESRRGARWQVLGLAAVVVVGALASAALRVPVVLHRSAIAQRQIVEAAAAFLRPGETYLAGTELLWRQQPHLTQLIWLDQVRLNDLRHDSAAALAELRATPPRLLIDNYRLENLPQSLMQELGRSYVPVAGNLRSYAPALPNGAAETHFAYGGLYVVRAPAGGQVRVDAGPWLRDGERVDLAAGTHHTEVADQARLVSWSDAPAFQRQVGRPAVKLFDRMYSY
jgi:hypothetical protein